MNIKANTLEKRRDIETALQIGEAKSTLWLKIKWLIGIALVVMIVLIVLKMLGRGGDGRPAQYNIVPAVRADLTVTVTATGTVEPTNDVYISSELSGKIVKVNVDHNDEVKIGQILAELDTDQLGSEVTHAKAVLAVKKAKVAEAEATLLETKNEFLRVSSLAKRDLAADTELDVARAAYQRSIASLKSTKADVLVAESDLELKEILLKKAYIRSSINGIVLKRNTEPGQIVASTLQAPILFLLAEDIKHMQLEVDIDEADIGSVREGQGGHFRVDAYTDQKFPAVINELRFAPEIVEGVVTYKAVLGIDNSELLLRPGMTATAEIVVEQMKDAILISNAALRYVPQENDRERPEGFDLMSQLRPRRPPKPTVKRKQVVEAGKRKIWILKDDEPVAVLVTTGATDGSRTQVLSGDLHVGDQVITGTMLSENMLSEK